MIATLAKTVQNELLSALYPGEVDMVYNQIPETVTELKNIFVIRRRKLRLGAEIGYKLPTHYRYLVDIQVVVGNTDYETAVADLEKLERLVIKTLDASTSITSLQDVQDGHSEVVHHFSIASTDYPQTDAAFDNNTQMAVISLEIDTEFKPVV